MLPPHRRTTQNNKPWQAVLRTVFAASLGLLPLLPEIARAAGIAEWPQVAGVLAITAAVTRVLSLPSVEHWLQTYFPWLSAAGSYEGRHRLDEQKEHDENDNH